MVVRGEGRATRRVLAYKAANRGIVVSGAVVHQSGLGVQIAGGIAVRITRGATGSGRLPESVSGVGVGQRAADIGQRSYGPERSRVVRMATPSTA